MSTTSSKLTKTATKPLRHLGLILDGNRRWARERNLSSARGHSQGLKRVEPVIKEAFAQGVEIVSLFIFSSENWNRESIEVKHLMKLFLRYFKKGSQKLIEAGYRFKVAGQINQLLSFEIRQAIRKLELTSAKNTAQTIVLCFNYGGQLEILDMVKKLIQKQVNPKTLKLKDLRQELYHPEIPDIDFIIRTSGEQRLSGFQLWRAAYAEMLFVDKYWPDFLPQDLRKGLAVYYQRQRRLGR